MKSLAFLCVGLAAIVVPVSADSTDRVIIAAMRLSEQPNYSWFSTVDGESSTHEIEGRTTPAGITWVRMPMVAGIGRQLGRQRETQLEALFHGNSAAVVLIDNQWSSLAELAVHRRGDESRSRPMVRGSANAGNFGMAGGQSVSVGAAAPLLEDGRNQPLDGPGFGVTHPHEELAIVISSFGTMDIDGDIVTGTLLPLGAALLLVRADQPNVEPIIAAGKFKLWLKDGGVIKYQLTLEGVIAIGRWRKLDVRRSSTTILRDVGTTNVIVPDEALRKLSAARGIAL
jgi:hypothetical protein